MALAIGISWAWWIPPAAAGERVERGDAWPTHLVGVLGPVAAAVIVLASTEGRAGLRRLGAASLRRPRGRWWLATLWPLLALPVLLAVAAAAGDGPSPGALGRMSGAPQGLLVVVPVLLVIAYGEEAGWRGYLLPRLQERLGAGRAIAAVAACWAAWHLPLFALLASYRDFGPPMVAGFLVGLAAGAVVLAWLYNGTGGSVLAVTIWHAAYNLGAGTDAGEGLVAPALSALVVVLAVSLVQRARAGTATLGPAGTAR